MDYQNNNTSNQFTTYELVTIDDWDVKLSRLDDQLLIAIQNRDSGLTDVRFFTSEILAFQWIDYVTQLDLYNRGN